MYVTAVEGPDKDTCHLIAVALADGAVAWKQSIETSDKVKSSLYVSRAAPTGSSCRTGRPSRRSSGSSDPDEAGAAVHIGYKAMHIAK